MTPEVPGYATCRENSEISGGCQILKSVRTQIGPGFACEVCQMTYIRVDKGAYIPFDQAMALAVKQRKQEEERERRAAQSHLRAKAPKKRRRRS